MSTKTITKFFSVWNFDKEEMWLNEMADQGWKLEKVGFCKYTFTSCNPGEYSIRLQLDEAENLDPSVRYIDRFARWHYYSQRTEDGPFELMDNLDSKIEHLERIIQMLKIICLANICIGIANSHREIGWVNLLAATVLAYGWGRIAGKKDSLEKDKFLFES